MNREDAILELWRAAVREVTIVHLDPSASAVCEVLRVDPADLHGNLVVGRIRIENARDTSKLNEKTYGVALPWKAVGWPGRVFVHSFVAACWSAVMAHEGLETTLYTSRFNGIDVPPKTRIHDPHTTTVSIDIHGTHFAAQGRMRDLVKHFIGDIEPIGSEQSELEILLQLSCNSTEQRARPAE